MRRYCSTTAGAMFLLLLAGCGQQPMPVTDNGGATFASSKATPAIAASTAGYNMAAPQLPDPMMTPGAALAVTSGDFCVPGYSKKVRNVPASVKKQVYAEYGITSRKRGEYEVDHLISLQLGGSNSIKNLWPQSYKTQPWNASVKDQLENKLHELICSGQIDTATAQHDISTDWIAAYKKYFDTSVPLAAGRSDKGRDADGTDKEGEADMSGSGPASAAVPSTAFTPAPSTDAAAQTPANAGEVWVNTKSGKYFRAGSSHYGKTKQGQFMSESDARAKGYIAAKE